MRNIVLVVLSLGALLDPTRLFAQHRQDVAAVRAVADSFFLATAAQRWPDAVALLDLPTFERQLRQAIKFARTRLPHPEMTVEELMARDSTLPRAVAAWQVEQSRRSEGPAFGDFSHECAGVTSFRMLQSLTPAQAAARWLEAQDPNVRLRRLMSELRCGSPVPDSVRTTALQTYVGHPLRTIGAVVVDDSTAYVLVVESRARAFAGDFESPHPTVVRMRPGRQGWRVVADHKPYAGQGVIGVGCG